MKSTGIRILLVVALLAAVGIVFSFVATWRSVEVTDADAARAALAFEMERMQIGSADPIITFYEGGHVRRPVPAEPQPAPSTLFMLVYHRPSGRLARAEVGFWFLRMKGPASERVLSGAGIDLQALGLTVDELERYGPALVLDAQRGDNRVLVWTR